MIEFNGELSDQCKRYIQIAGTKIAFINSLIVTIIFSIIIIIVGFLWEWIVIIFIVIPILVNICVAIPQINSPLKILNLYLPRKVTIEGEIISSESDKISAVRSIENVKKVIDKGEWYNLIFYFPYKNMYFICQKDLITKGTIEEFEELFKGKIERKIQNFKMSEIRLRNDSNKIDIDKKSKVIKKENEGSKYLLFNMFVTFACMILGIAVYLTFFLRGLI